MIDPYWWCRHDEEWRRKFWKQACQPLALAMLKQLDDPKFWNKKQTLPDVRPAWWDNESESVYSDDPEVGYPYDE